MRPAAVRCDRPRCGAAYLRRAGVGGVRGRRWRALLALASAGERCWRWRALLAGTEETFIMAKRGFETTAYCTALLYVYSVAPRARTPSVNS